MHGRILTHTDKRTHVRPRAHTHTHTHTRTHSCTLKGTERGRGRERRGRGAHIRKQAKYKTHAFFCFISFPSGISYFQAVILAQFDR